MDFSVADVGAVARADKGKYAALGRLSQGSLFPGIPGHATIVVVKKVNGDTVESEARLLMVYRW